MAKHFTKFSFICSDCDALYEITIHTGKSWEQVEPQACACGWESFICTDTGSEVGEVVA